MTAQNAGAAQATSMSSGTYAGIAVGCVVVVALMVGMACFMNKGKDDGDDKKLAQVLSIIHAKNAHEVGGVERPSAGFEHWQAVTRSTPQFRPYVPSPPSSNGSVAGDRDRRPSVQMSRMGPRPSAQRPSMAPQMHY